MSSSYVHGASDIPLLGETIGEVLARIVEREPEHDALVIPYQQVRWSYAELARRVTDVAAGLVALGLEPGERIGVCSPNNAEWVLLQLATARAGLILVNLNPGYRRADLAFALNAVGCSTLVTAATLKTSDYIGMLYELAPELARCEPGDLHARQIPSLRWVIRLGEEQSAGMLNFGALAGLAQPEHQQRLSALETELQFDDPVNIQFTSGTTGKPKAATLTHHNIVNNAYFVGLQMDLSAADRMCIPVPMYHCFGMVLGTLCCIAHGATMVFASPSFDPQAVLRTVEAETCTVLHGVPTMFIAELDDERFGDFDLSSLRTGIMAGAPCPMELMKHVIERMHLREITIAYGMTETGPVSFQTRIDDPLPRRVGSVGRVLPHVEVKIVDQQGQVVPRGTQGELLTRGYNVMRGYWNDAGRTAAAIDAAGWIASGDLAKIDDQGYCQIVGRSKDMLIRGGENIYPREIEEFLYRHPKVDTVEVIGVPDEKYGEEICAWIKLRSGEQASAAEIREFCRGKIAHFKIPRYVKFVDSFPMTVTGKVQKYIMRERMSEELADAQASSQGADTCG
ncbi:MAG: AMP-binding protein [Gammaproteobacteria bacterium]|nr:AMP-binding protein [Gammaproteobacteria bacterium]